MKKAILVILIILSCSQVFALSSFYMAPYGAAVVNLNTPAWSTPQDISQDNGGVGGKGGRVFDTKRILFIGGIEGLKSESNNDEFSDYGLRVQLSGSTWDGEYFWFTKQSDPEFTCPFKVQISAQIHTSTWIVFWTEENDAYSDMGYYIPSSGNEENGKILEAGATGFWSWLASLFKLGTTEGNLIFEFGIVLPYDLDNNSLIINDANSIRNGEIFPLASGDDYSTEITVTATLVYVNDDNYGEDVPGYAPISFTVPISGYYDAKSEITPPETSASLFVDAYSRAANLDLLNNQGENIPIGSVDFSVYGLDPVETDANGNYAHTYDDSVFLFLSASPNPYVQDTAGFRFIHDDVGFGDAITASNSIGYTIQCVPTEDITSVDGSLTAVEFDGTDYLSDANGVVTPPENKRVKTAHFQQSLGELVGGYEHWHSYNGELILTLDENPIIMQSGLYRSNVYVHVVTDDSLGGN